MTEDDELRQDELLNDATHAAAAVFEAAGIPLATEELYRINDLLTEILGGRVPRARG